MMNIGAAIAGTRSLASWAGKLMMNSRERKHFFSEEKKQKTFASALAYRYGTWPDRG
jgi:hypothetical protein